MISLQNYIRRHFYIEKYVAFKTYKLGKKKLIGIGKCEKVFLKCKEAIIKREILLHE